MTHGALVRVPASSANLGPGFDSFAAALALHLEVEVQDTGQFAVETTLPVPTGRDNLCVRAFELLHPADGLTFVMRSSIPLTGGLGSSAAAIVAGLAAANHLAGLGADLLALATELEGHPDNVAAALHGGFVVCADGQATAVAVPAGLEAVAVSPVAPPEPAAAPQPVIGVSQAATGALAGDHQGVVAAQVSTATARAALPAAVPMADAVFNIAHAALLVLGLNRGDWELVARGLHDRVHQDRRGSLYPRSHALMCRAPELGALGATISGAGPTVLVWCLREQTGAVVEALRAEVAEWATAVPVAFERQGVSVCTPTSRQT